MTEQFQSWEFIQRKENHEIEKYMHLYVHYCIIYNSQDTGAI